jgi:phosphoglycolate phosphatase
MKNLAGPAVTLVCCGLVGTLVADDGLIERAFSDAIATQGVVAGTSAYARRMAQVHQARGQSPADVLSTLFPDNEARAQAALLAFERALADAVRRTEFPPLPGIVAALQQLSATGLQVCAMTSLPRAVVDAVIAAAGLRRQLSLSLSAEEVSRGFPAPDLVLTALLRCGAGAVSELAVVHSTGAGVESGRRCGAGLVAGVLTGPHAAARLRAAGAGQILRSFAGLPRLVLAPVPPEVSRPGSPAGLTATQLTVPMQAPAGLRPPGGS